MSENQKSNAINQTIIAGVVGLVVGILGTWAITQMTGGKADEVVAEYNGKKVRASEVFEKIKTRLFDLEDELFRIKERAINDYIEKQLLEAQSKKANLPVDQLIAKEMGGETGDVSEQEITDFLKSKGLSLKDPRIKKDDVKEYLKFRKRHEKKQAYVANLKKSANVKVFLKEPIAPQISVTTAGYPSWGNPNAPVTIVEFSDFQCPFCARAIPTLARIKQEYGPDKVRIVFRDMPLPSHSRAEPAAHAGLCMNEQGKFWEYHDKLFENQSKLADKDLLAFAKELGANMDQFKKCFDSKKYQAKIDATKREASGANIRATPSFVINGSLLQGAQPFDKFKAKIDGFLKKG